MRVLSVCVFAAIAVSANVVAQDGQDVRKATEAAQRWLQLTDTKQYGATYLQAAPAFRQAIQQPDWERALRAAREPLGELRQRTVASATFQKNLPGAAPGAYVVVIFKSEFANKSAAVETVTPMRDASGEWKVSGYFVR